MIERVRVDELLQALAATGMPGLLRLELCVLHDALGRGMTGSGLIVVNPPWPLLEAGNAGLAWAAARLDAAGPTTCSWLVPPA